MSLPTESHSQKPCYRRKQTNLQSSLTSTCATWHICMSFIHTSLCTYKNIIKNISMNEGLVTLKDRQKDLGQKESLSLRDGINSVPRFWIQSVVSYGQKDVSWNKRGRSRDDMFSIAPYPWFAQGHVLDRLLDIEYMETTESTQMNNPSQDRWSCSHWFHLEKWFAHSAPSHWDLVIGC